MADIIEGDFQAKGLRFGIACSRFNDFIVRKLLDGALDALARHGAADAAVTVVRAPGSLEIAAVAKRMIQSDKYDAVICLGAVIRGGTPHFDYVASEATKGIAYLSLNSAIPVIMGVLTTDTIEQAIERAGTKAGNKGFDAAMTAVEMARLYQRI